jgi:glycerol-3-phosphate dehydrogenase
MNFLANLMQQSKKSISYLGGNRSVDLSPFDVIVVGGGALGCAVTWESASRGLRVALLERDDFGCATSANSLNIIHGGLRYLQKLNLRRARSSSRERAILLRIAPHIISPLECVIPTTQSLKRGRLAFFVGLGINRLVMAGQNEHVPASHKLRGGGLLSRTELAEKAPGLSMNGVSGAAFWEDGCMSSGERLALAFVQSANEHDATVLGHFAVERTFSRNGRIAGVIARDLIGGDHCELSADVVLDCRGVGVTESPEEFGGSDLGVDFVKAVNIVIGDRGLKSAIGAPVRNEKGDPIGGRLLFARPSSGDTVVGTWYFDTGALAESLLPGETEEILLAVNSAFPGWRVTADEIVDVQVGFLPRKKSTKTELLPIEHPMIIEAASSNGNDGLWHIQTEKWTTVRALAERVVTEVCSKEGLRVKPSSTHEKVLCGGERLTLTEEQSEIFTNLDESQSSRLATHYGGRLPKVLDYALKDRGLAESLDVVPNILKAEIPYIMNYEMVRTIEDLKRRLSLDKCHMADVEVTNRLTELVNVVHDRNFLEKNHEPA